MWASTYRRTEVPATLVDELEELGGVRHLAVLNEDWCIDAIGSVPVLARLADLVEGMDLRVFGRDTFPELMDAHLTNGARSIPVVIVYDGDWVERGWWGPRPAPLQAWVKEHAASIEKEEKYRHIRAWFAKDRGRTTLREVADVILGAGVVR